MKRHASMNRVYRMVWNEQTGTMVAVAENARGRGKRTVRGLLLTTALLASGWSNLAQAAPTVNQLPTGAQVLSGIASVTQSGNVMTVKQGSDKLIANWSSFNIGQDAKVQFVQPGSSSVALNRISDASPSQIFGQLSANGQVFLLNPSGIVFGASARVDVGALVASTLDLSNDNFLAGNYRFARSGNAGSIVNQGSINANANAGADSVVAFIAPQVSNLGSITASGGSVALAAGDKVSLDFSGNGLIKVQVDQGTFNAVAENKGLIQADGGAVIMTAKTASDLMDAVVNNEGTIQARTLQNKGGRILLLSDMAHGETRVGGTLDASAPQGGDGGFIETSAAHVKVSDSARVTTLAPAGKSGTWLIDPNDFTISPTGDMLGSSLGLALESGNVTIQTATQGTPGGFGDIYVNEQVFINGVVPVTSTLTLMAERDIVFQASSAIDARGNAGPVSVVLQSNATDAVGGGAIVMLPGSGIYSNGGSITLSGGSIPFASTYAVGRDGLGALGGVAGVGGGADAGNGIAMIGATLSSAGGNVVLRGKSVSGGNVVNSTGIATADGVLIHEQGATASLIDSGAGTITINGLATGTITATDLGHAVRISPNSKIKSAAPAGTAISITGDASVVTATTGSSGIANDGTIEAIAGGNVAITGTGGSDVSPLGPYGFGVHVNGQVLASSGSITMIGYGATYGIGMGNLSATGILSVTESVVPASLVSLTSNSAMRLGGAISATGDVTLVSATGTDIQGPVSSTSGTVSLQTGTGPGMLSFGGYITAPNLLLNGADFQLKGQPAPIDGIPSSNAVGTLAATVTGSGGLSFMNSGDLAIGTVGATNGVTVGGFSAITTSGNLTIKQNVTSTYNAGAGNLALALVAGNETSGGEITLTGLPLPVISVGSGAAGLFSSTIAGSAGVAAQVGAGNFRYNSSFQLGKANGPLDYTLTAGYTTVLGNGLNLIYREQPAVTLAVTSPAITYGQVPSLGATVDISSPGPIQNADAVGTPQVLSPLNSSAGFLAAGTYSVAPSVALVGLGYTVNSVPGSPSLAVNQASISAVTGITGTNRAYDGTTAATISTGAAGFTGMVVGDVLSVAAGATGAFVDKNVGNAKTVNVSGLALTGTDAGNYTLASSTATTSANITAASISAVTGITATNRAYDGTTAATLNTGAAGFTGMVAGDVLSVAAGATGAFVDKNVGNAKVVNVSGLALAGTDAGNYTLAASTATANGNITAASISAVTGITATNRVYDGTTAATLNTGAAGFTGIVAGDVLSVAAGATGAFVDKNVGNAKVVNVSALALAGTDAGNYTLASSAASASGNITAASLSISGATAASRAYDGTTNASIAGATLTGTVYAGDVVSLTNASSGLFADKNVGTAKVVSTAATLSGAGAANYTLTQPTGLTANITAASLSVSGAAAQNKVYDGTTNASITGATLAGTVYAGDVVSLANASSGLFADKNVGTAKAVSTAATLSGAGATNYTLTQLTGLTASITAASLSISGATAASRAYDGTTNASIGGATLAGTVYAGDVVSLANASSGNFADKNVGTAKAVSTAATLSGAGATNYTLTQPTGLTANITAASLSVSGAAAQNKVYDGTTNASITGATLAGTVYAGDVVSLANAGSGLFADKNVGTAKAVSTAATLSGAGATNYTLTQPTGLTANITAASLSISGASAQNKVYDGTTNASITGATLAGTVYAGDVVSLANASSGNFVDSNVGVAKVVNMSATLSGVGAGNYTLQQPTGLTADITNVAPSAGALVTQLAPAKQSSVNVTTSTTLVSSSTQQSGLISFGPGITPPTPPSGSTTTGTAPLAGSTSSTATSTSSAPTGTDPTASAGAPDGQPNAVLTSSGSGPGSGSGAASSTQDRTVSASPPATTPATGGRSTASTAPAQSGTQAAAPGKQASTVPTTNPSAKAATKSTATKPASSSNQVAKVAPVRAGNTAPRSLPSNMNAALAGRGSGALRNPDGLLHDAPEAIKNFGASVPDVVGQNNPLLAENRVMPKALEQSIQASRQDEMAQSYDSIPSVMSGTRSKKGGQSKAVNLFEETLEIVNFLNLLTLKIVP